MKINLSKIGATSIITILVALLVYITNFKIFILNLYALSWIVMVAIVVLWLRYRLTFWKRQGIPNNVLHNFKAFGGVIPTTDLECIQKYGKIVGTYELIWPTLLVSEPELITKILIKNFHEFSDHRIWVAPEQPVGKALFLLPYDSWKVARTILSRAFTTCNLKKMKYIFDESVQPLLKTLEKAAVDGNTVDMKPCFESFTMDVLTSAFFATKVDSANDPNNPIVCNSRQLFSGDLSFSQMIAIFSPLLAKIFGLHAINQKSCNVMADISLKIIEERREKDSERTDLIQLMLDAENDTTDYTDVVNSAKYNRKGNSAPVIFSSIATQLKNSLQLDSSTKKGLTNEEIIDNCVLFFVAAFDTTTAALSHMSYFLAVNPQVQDKLIEEIDKYSNTLGINEDSMARMDYLDACLKETLRLIPSLPRIERKAICDFRTEDLFIPKDTLIAIPTYAVHRDPDNYENPDEFIPDRFLPENKNKIKPGTFIPFADGPRNCIGMRFAITEIKYCIAYILQKYKFVSCSETKYPEFYSGQPISLPKNILVKIQSRNVDNRLPIDLTETDDEIVPMRANRL